MMPSFYTFFFTLKTVANVLIVSFKCANEVISSVWLLRFTKILILIVSSFNLMKMQLINIVRIRVV